MKNSYKIQLLLLFFVFAACKNEVEKPKVIYNKTATKTTPSKADSTQVLIADLPIQIPGTSYLIYPVAALNIAENLGKTAYESSKSYEVNFRISNYSDNEITGYLKNLKFQEISTDSIKSLTNKPVLIQTVTYLKTVFEKTKQHVLVYNLIDSDTNIDGKLDDNDVKSLYLSAISGSRFTKMSLDFQELIDWELIESNNHLYFRTVEDTNKNGKFDKNDLIHYHYIDLSNSDWKVFNFSPI
ncbi:MAG TPA: hypothetical protein VN192_07810 [Flavobacterium sp.]|nr:hypothetical protein [Flavobacterium sp.]